MMQDADYAKSISDAAWSQTINYTTYKAGKAGRIVKMVNPAYTSQTCRMCGHCEKANRVTQAKFECVKCHHTENADLNAANNILRLGLESVGKQSVDAASKLCLVVE